MKPTRLPLAFTPTPAPLPSAIRGALPATQGGFGLLETILIAAAGVGLVTAAVMTYNRTAATHKVAREAEHIGALFNATTRVYGSRASFDGLDTAGAVAGGIVPADLLDGNANPVNPWGGTVSVAAQADPDDAPGAPARGFTIAYSNVPASVCASLAANAGSGFSLVTVRSASQGGYTPAAPGMNSVITPPGPPPVDVYAGSVMSATQAGRVDPTLATQRCASDGNTVAFTYFKTGIGTTSPVCSTPPAPDVGNRTQLCPGRGQDLLPFAPYASSWPQSRSRDYTCNASGTADVGPWSPWTPTYTCVPACAPTTGTNAGTFTCALPLGLITTPGAYQYQHSAPNTTPWTRTCSTPVGPLGTVVNGATTPAYTCAPVCAPTSATQWVAASALCPAGQSGSHTWEKEQTHAATCPAPTGPVGPWSPWADTGNTRNDVNTCAPNCVPPSPSTASRTVACTPPTTGSWSQTQTTTWTCPAPTGPATSSTGAWLPTTEPAGACTTPPTCTLPTPTFQTRCGSTTGSVACPAGQSGAHTWNITQRRDAFCSSPSAPYSWGAWSNTGSRCNEVNSCAPTPVCTHPASPPTSQSPACPANPGGWVQSRTCIESACPPAGGPTTWSCSAWSNPTAPASCTPAVRHYVSQEDCYYNAYNSGGVGASWGCSAPNTWAHFVALSADVGGHHGSMSPPGQVCSVSQLIDLWTGTGNPNCIADQATPMPPSTCTTAGQFYYFYSYHEELDCGQGTWPNNDCGLDTREQYTKYICQ